MSAHRADGRRGRSRTGAAVRALPRRRRPGGVAKAHTRSELVTDRPDKHDARPRVADHVGRVGNVLPIIGVEGLARGLGVTGGDDERPAIEPGAKPVGNAAGGAHDGPFAGPMALDRHADGGSNEIVHLQVMIDAAPRRRPDRNHEHISESTATTPVRISSLRIDAVA